MSEPHLAGLGVVPCAANESPAIASNSNCPCQSTDDPHQGREEIRWGQPAQQIEHASHNQQPAHRSRKDPRPDGHPANDNRAEQIEHGTEQRDEVTHIDLTSEQAQPHYQGDACTDAQTPQSCLTRTTSLRLQCPHGGQAEQKQGASHCPRDGKDEGIASRDRVSDDKQERDEPTGKQSPASYNPKGYVLILLAWCSQSPFCSVSSLCSRNVPGSWHAASGERGRISS